MIEKGEKDAAKVNKKVSDAATVWHLNVLAVRACRHTAAAGMRRRPGSRLPSVGCGSQPNTPQRTAKARRQPAMVFKKIAAAAHQKIDAVEETFHGGGTFFHGGVFFSHGGPRGGAGDR